VVKWISQRSSEPLFWVRILAGAQEIKLNMLIDIKKVPDFVKYVSNVLEEAGFSTYLVGGCVRDLLLGREPKDFDLTTLAKPEDIVGLFPKTVYENVFGTVMIINEETGESVEVTPFRKEGTYTDMRHPDNVIFSDSIMDDLSRRDFTVNAMAYRLETNELVDVYNGQDDLSNKIIKTVGVSDERFTEDALRLMRAVRFSSELGFAIDGGTMDSLVKNAHLIQNISQERIRDEFVKIINSDNPSLGIDMLRRVGIIKFIIPELLDGVGCVQGGAHKFDVYEHLLHALKHSADKKYPFHIRLSALFHDIGKPKSRRVSDDPKKKQYTFYGHEVIGAKMAKKIMERMKFSSAEIDLVYKMVRYHMFFSDTDVITLSPVRRMIQNVGVEHIWELMEIRECDRVGMSKTEAPYRLRKYHAMIEQALRDPISVKQLKINGQDVMNAGINPGPRMGWILLALLEEVIEDPRKNEQDYLLNRVSELDKLTDVELKKLGTIAKDKKDELEEEEIQKLHQKHNVKK
jgi:tRNA nucleotidyltransferase (CCA-adding enzyme)